MDLIAAETWKKRASFKSINSTMHAKMDVHGTVYLISFISFEISMEVTTVYMYLNKVKEFFMSDLTNIRNLSGLVFLRSIGHKTKNLSSVNLKDHIAHLAYIKLSYCMKEKSIGLKIQHLVIYL